MENVEVKLVESKVCMLQTIGSLFIVQLMVPGVNHALPDLLFTMINVDNVKLLTKDLVLDQVSYYFLYTSFLNFLKKMVDLKVQIINSRLHKILY